MEEILHQLAEIVSNVYPTIYKDLDIPGGLRGISESSTVVCNGSVRAVL